MPYRSKKQRAALHAKAPKVAKKWDEKYGGKIVPKKKVKKAVKRRRR